MYSPSEKLFRLGLALVSILSIHVGAAMLFGWGGFFLAFGLVWLTGLVLTK